jgi:radical SAM-linked protein
VFSRGWHRLKLYFMIGLPTEEDEDVRGIVETGERMLAIGRKHFGKKAEVTVSVSSHVPKPHTPFQWCAQDSYDEITRKQQLLRSTVRERRLKLKYHHRGISFVEGVLARGDRRLADAIELVWKRGARFDGWDECFDVERWRQAFADCGIDTETYLGTRPVTARLPWDHIDVGLEDGFLLGEYRKALKSRLSPPCGKVAGQLIHHTNIRDALADRGKLVCYDCGVACDLTQMRAERVAYLRDLGAEEPPPPRPPVMRAGALPKKDKNGRTHRKPRVEFPELPTTRFRMRYTKLRRAAYLGHLDTARALARLMRRAGIEVAYSRGFHPKPMMQFSPALSLGVASFGELLDVHIEGEWEADALLERVRQVAPEGNEFTAVWKLGNHDPALGKLIKHYDLLIAPASTIAGDEAALHRYAEAFLSADSIEIPRKKKVIDVRGLVSDVSVVDGEASARLAAALGWPEVSAMLRARVDVSPFGSAKPREVAQALAVWGTGEAHAPRARLARLGFPDVAGQPTAARSLLGEAPGPADSRRVG